MYNMYRIQVKIQYSFPAGVIITNEKTSKCILQSHIICVWHELCDCVVAACVGSMEYRQIFRANARN